MGDSINVMLQKIWLLELGIGWGVLLLAFLRAHPWARLQSRTSRSSSAGWGYVFILTALLFLLIPYSPSGAGKPALFLQAAIVLAFVSFVISVAALFGTRRKLWMPEDERHPMLPKTGIFSSIRHPVYTSLIFLAAATAVTRTWWLMMGPGFFFLILGIALRAAADDLGLANVFQEEFLEYQAQTRSYFPLIR